MHAPADFTEAAASDEDVSAAVVDGRLLLTLTAWGGDPVWPPAGDDSPTTDAPPVDAEGP
ncbi:hypothetical protein ACFQ77_34685 [Streptomyces virginiae]|uniref:hypothetical protein n=1 Tax=Streptomyces virginiae TaxID=1961 RepID=UPI00369F8A9F